MNQDSMCFGKEGARALILGNYVGILCRPPLSGVFGKEFYFHFVFVFVLRKQVGVFFFFEDS